MAENYSLNSKFGLNVSTKGTPNQQAQKTSINSSSIGDLFDSLESKLSKYDSVFNGDVEKQINMYSRQSMIVGMNLKAGEVKRQFDVNI